MSGLEGALSAAYDFATRAAEMVYPAGVEVDANMVIEYWDDATGSRVQTIRVLFNDATMMPITLKRDDEGKWIAIAGVLSNGV